MTQTSSGADETSTTDRVRGAGSHVAGTAAEEASNVKSEVSHQARNLVGQVRSQLTSQVSTQQEKAAGGIRSVSDELRSMADSSQSQGMASNLVSQAASRADDVAGWLEGRDPSDLLEDVKRFARRQPGVFIALAAGAGILVGRLAKSLTSGSDESSTSTDTSYLASQDDLIVTDDSLTAAGYTTTGAAYGTPGYGETADYTTTPGYTEPVEPQTPGYETGGVR